MVVGGLGWLWMVFSWFWAVVGGLDWLRWFGWGGCGWFWLVFAGFGWLWVVVGGFGSFLVLVRTISKSCLLAFAMFIVF